MVLPLFWGGAVPGRSQEVRFRWGYYLPRMNERPKLSGPQEHIYHADVRTWDKAKVYARENRKVPTPDENIL